MTKLLIEVEGLWSFSASDGVQRRELETGTSAWALDLPVPGPQDPAPRLAGGALYSAAEGELRAVDAETGELLWSSRLEGPAPPTNLHPLGDVVLVRSSPPGNWFQDGEDRWGVELPPAWSLSVHDGDRWTFRPELGSGRLTVATAADAHDPREMVEQQIAGVASSGWLDSSRVTHEELTLRGRPAHLVRAPFRAESGGTEIEMTAYLGAVAGSSSGPGLYWLAFVSRDEDERVGPLLEGAFRTIRVFSRSGGARADDERGRGAHHLAAYDADTGGYRWGFSTVRPTLSNVLLADGRLYVAGGRTLYALQASTGAPIFRVTASTSGGTFPVRLRLYEDRVVYVGELVISAFDRRTGAELYRRGFSPITQRAYLAGLDASIPRFRRRLAREGGRPAPSGGEGWVELSRWQGAQARRYQEMATSYANQAFSAQQLGRGMEAQTLQLKARMNRAWSRTQTNLALMSSVAGLFSAIEQIREARERRARIGQYRRYLSQQRYLRSSILSAYSQAETGDYVYRPTSTRPPEADGALTQVGIVHLPTGRWRTFPLSPRYLDYGLWNYLAAGRGLLLHHGLGLAPERYRYGEPMELAPHGEASTLEGFLVAVPVELPR